MASAAHSRQGALESQGSIICVASAAHTRQGALGSQRSMFPQPQVIKRNEQGLHNQHLGIGKIGRQIKIKITWSGFLAVEAVTYCVMDRKCRTAFQGRPEVVQRIGVG